MEESLFRQMGGTYRQVGDYILPNLELPEEKEKDIGVWGQRHQRFLKECHRIRYYNLLTTGKLNPYLAEIDCRAEEMFAMLVKELSEKEDVTEALKSMFPMEWVRKMNSICNRAMEIVNSEVIFQ